MDHNKNGIERESFNMGCMSALIISALIWIVMLLALAGCSPRVIESVRTEYVYRDRVQVDTMWRRDSVFIKEKTKGDTVFITEYRDHLVYQYKYLSKVDTVIVHDSLAVETIKEVKVEKPLSAGQKEKIGAFWYLVVAVLGFGLWTFRKPLLKLIKPI